MPDSSLPASVSCAFQIFHVESILIAVRGTFGDDEIVDRYDVDHDIVPLYVDSSRVSRCERDTGPPITR